MLCGKGRHILLPGGADSQRRASVQTAGGSPLFPLQRLCGSMQHLFLSHRPPVTTLTITRPDDWHVHLRDGAALQHTCADMARYFGRAIVMPNLTPPVTTVAEASAYRQRILDAMQGLPRQFEPLMTLYLTDCTTRRGDPPGGRR